MKKIFLKLFLICTFKDPNLAGNLTNLSENLFKKLNSAEFMEFVFSKSESVMNGCHGSHGRMSWMEDAHTSLKEDRSESHGWMSWMS